MTKKDNPIIITSILIFLSFILVIFSFIAPIIFTRNSIFPEIDFTNKGEIGDTIGGIMNPFIAIAGVITTFLAFLMQVKANKIQMEQFLASLQNENRKEEMDSFYNLQILKLDLDNIINNITSNINSLDEFIQETKQNPYAMCRLNRTSLKHYDRIRQIPRKMVFRGFQLYISPINKEWTKKFNQLYNAIDFASDGFENIYAIEKHHQDECFNIKIQIKEELIEVERKGGIILSSMDNFPDKDFRHNVSQLLIEYEKELKNSNDKRKEGDFLRIKEILTKFIWSVQYNTGVKNCYDTEYNYIEKVTNIIKKLNDIEQGTSQLIPNLELFKNNMYDKTDSCVNKIKEINNLIDQAIQKQINTLNNKNSKNSNS